MRPDITVFNEGTYESIFIELENSNGKNTVIGEIYRVLGSNCDEFFGQFKNYA